MMFLTHPDGRALYNAILANPDDDAPRLILADWLDENGAEARAEYIRLECAIDRDRFSDEALAWRQRRDDLLAHVQPPWTNELPHLAGVIWGPYRRGFCHHCRIASVAAYQEMAQRIREFAPTSSVGFTNHQSLNELATSELLRDLRGLGLGHLNTVNDAVLTNLLQSRHLQHLDTLCVGGTTITGASIRALARCAKLTDLRQLELYHTPCGNTLLELGSSPTLRKLEVLDIRTTGLTPSTLRQLVNAPALTTLRRLRLNDALGSDGVVALAESPVFANLVSLEIGLTEIAGSWLGPLVATPHARSLRELTVVGLLRNRGVQALAQSPHLVHLRSLLLLTTDPPHASFTQLLQAPALANLRQLSLGNMHLSDSLVKALIDSPTLTQLERLDINWADLTNTAKQQLRERFGTKLGPVAPTLYR